MPFKKKEVIQQSSLDPKVIEKMKEKLLHEKTRLQGELDKFTHRNPKAAEARDAIFPAFGDSMDENASEVAQFTDNLSLEGELEKELRDTIAALGMIEKGTYGMCKYCGQPIDERRLDARATSSSCIKCKKTLTQEV